MRLLPRMSGVEAQIGIRRLTTERPEAFPAPCKAQLRSGVLPRSEPTADSKKQLEC